MKKQLFLIVSVVLALGLSSCSKKMGDLSPDLFKVTPNPLEVKGGKVEAKIDGKFPEKYFNKKAVVTVTPVLKFNGTEVKGQSQTFQGEKVTGNNKVIKTKTGGSFSIPASFNYVPEMINSELYLDFTAKIGDKEVAIPSVKVADGVIATAALAGMDAREIAPALNPDKFQRIIKEKQDAEILFLIQQANLRSNQLNSQGIKDFNAAIKDAKATENKEISSLSVKGYASPDGPYDLNKNLAEKRLDVTTNYLNKELKKMKSQVEIGKDFTPEDWEGFKKLMEASNIQDKQLILNVLARFTDAEQREIEMKKLASAYTVIADQILPELRRSRLQLIIDVTGKSDAEIANLAKTNPSQLSVEELLYAATLTDNLNDKSVIYQEVIKIYPQDFRGYNNLGMIQLYQNNIDAAAASLAKAASIDSSNPDVNYNLGLIALQKGQIDKAEQYFGKAAGTNGELNQAMGTLYIAKGDYPKAKSSFSSTASNNAALLQILNADYNGARRTLSSVDDPNAMTSYLYAVVGARTNDRDAVYENLRKAVREDRKMAERAMKDLEFSKFAADQTFLSIVK